MLSASQCFACSPGHYSTAGSSLCNLCPASTFQSNFSATTCLNCFGCLQPLLTGQTTCIGSNIDAVVSNTLQTIAISFVGTSTIDKLTAKGNPIPCVSVFTSDTISMLGSAPKCQAFAWPMTMQISFSWGATIVPGQPMMFRQSLFDQLPNSSATIQVFLKPPVFIPAVSVSINAPQTVAFCDGVTLDASASFGNVFRPFVFSWTLVSWTAAPGLDTSRSSALQRATDVLTIASLQATYLVALNASDLPVGQTYVFQLKLTNWLGVSDTATVSGIHITTRKC
jgi:hypothetical protein